jgi:hypothetical protein
MEQDEMMPFKPKREAVQQKDGSWLLTVTPPAVTGFSPSTIVLTEGQYGRFLQWRMQSSLIQEVLPDLSAAQREILMTGISSEEFDAAFRDDE